MFKPKFNRIFWFVFVCLCSLLLNCSTFNCAKVQNEQLRGHCMVKCFHSDVETFRRAIGDKISTRQSCFEDCMRTFGSRGSFRNHHTQHLFTRLKRASENKTEDTTDWRSALECKINPLEPYMAIDNTYINVSFSNKAGNISADISWSRAPESANVTGYKFVYTCVLPPEFRCQDLDKSKRSTKVDLSSLKEDDRFYIKLITLPLKTSNVSFNFAPYAILLPDQTTVPVSQETTSPTADKSSLPNYVIIAVCVALISAVTLALVCCYLRYLRLSRSRKQDLGFEFDAFIIYNSADEEWVNKTLRRTLEDKYGLRCCLHYRDFIPGKPFRENMADSVYKSKKTIAVVSHNFFRSKYCSHEMDMALGCSLQRGDNSVIVIKLDDVDKNKLPKALKDRSFIDYGKLIERESWEKKLIDSMRPPSKQKTAQARFV